MSKGIVAIHTLTAGMSIEITEAEARALEALAGYGTDAFVERFYFQLGKEYMEPHEAGLRSFLDRVRANMPTELHRIDMAREAFKS